MRTLKNGDKGDDVKKLQKAINQRLEFRDAPNHKIKVDGELGSKTRQAFAYALYLLGFSGDVRAGVKKGSITPAEQKYVLNPGARTDKQLELAKKRVAAHRLARKRMRSTAMRATNMRRRIVALAEEAAANYRQHPGEYHYLAGGVANLIFLHPSPHNFRSDCSQFVASVYKAAGVQSPAAPLDHQWASTFSMVKSPHARVIPRSERRPGDLGMYGSRTAPHHVELWCGDKFIGHGSPPIDSLTPGEPDYYLTYDFLR